ncbi:TonB C-terminal domain-containing protein [bacterium]|nr:TonB C-terminal domain-containing protein [bacterium]
MNYKNSQLRQGKQASLPIMIFVSMFGHALAMLIFIIAPGLISSGDPEPYGGGPGGNVMWVSSSAIGQQGKISQKELTQDEPAPADRIKKLTAEEEVPPPSKLEFPDETKEKPKDEPKAKETMNVPLKDRKKEGEFGRGTDKREDAGKSGTKGLGKSGVGIGMGGPGDGGTGTGIPFPYQWYLDIVFTKIELAWRKPYLGENNQQQYITVVYFIIKRNGQVREVKVQETSGLVTVDRSCESAILGAVPFPPLPTQFTEPELPLRVTFQTGAN